MKSEGKFSGKRHPAAMRHFTRYNRRANSGGKRIGKKIGGGIGQGILDYGREKPGCIKEGKGKKARPGNAGEDFTLCHIYPSVCMFVLLVPSAQVGERKKD